jgi:hypothetical protein
LISREWDEKLDWSTDVFEEQLGLWQQSNLLFPRTRKTLILLKGGGPTKLAKLPRDRLRERGFFAVHPGE